jgi:hypothetical protein
VVLRAAHYAADDGTDDNGDDDDDRRDPPRRAIPRHLRATGTTILQMPFFVREGEGARAVAFCEWLLVCILAIWGWRGGRAVTAAFV